MGTYQQIQEKYFHKRYRCFYCNSAIIALPGREFSFSHHTSMCR